jgi:hypothetical protein
VSVWQWWVNGMRVFVASPRIRKSWESELRTGLYYGFTFPQTILPDLEGKPAMKTRVYLVIACLAIGFGVVVAAAYYITTQMAGTIEAR